MKVTGIEIQVVFDYSAPFIQPGQIKVALAEVL
jgi:hypothetical protein